ncbi:MAG: ricin-type beta-trefoil lectin domain protein [Acidobacteriaceae bacterium]|nr:ricin-type beta-trefoil lectin domain protein [Acidobacteriaceae bacterium]
MPLTPLCYSQIGGPTPPHNVIYWNGDSTELQTLASSPYTDVIVNFVVPDSNCNLGSNGNLESDIAASVQTLHDAGKTVLVSFGNAGSGQYAACASMVSSLAGQLAGIVQNNGFDGVDIDFEDTSAFQGQAGYDGVDFLTQLTNNLYNQLQQQQPWPIITHAPATPYWLQNYSYSQPPYVSIFYNTVGEIAWFNNQTYNNCTDGPPATDCTAQQKISDYQSIVGVVGEAKRVVMGLPVSTCATGANNNCTGDGYIPLDNDPNGNDMRTVISTLQADYPFQFGGIMGWNYLRDLSDDNGSWGTAISGALIQYQPTWVGANIKTGLCLDTGNYNANNGNVYTDTCTGSSSQNWQFKVNTIVDAQTGLCLDSNYNGNVYTDSCNTGNFQNWEFYGGSIFDRRTGRCLQDNNGTVVTAACNVGNLYQAWTSENLPGYVGPTQ